MIALSLDRDDAGVLAALTAGAAIGFLWHNFHPASIFMGDAGSNLLGLLLACVAIQGVLKTAAVVALFFPLLILAVPALDATFVVAKRIKYGRPVYSADRWHFHHRFANIGFSQRRTVLYLYGWTLSLAALALAMRFVPYSDDDGTLQRRLDARDRGVRADRRGGQRLPRARARDPQVQALPRARAAPPGGDRRDRRADAGRDRAGDRARGRDRRVQGGAAGAERRPRRTSSRPSPEVLFRRRSLDGIRAGEITLAFRRWDRARARAGGRQRTVVGELAIDSVEPVDRAEITAADAARAGHASLDELFAELDARGQAQIWRIELHWAGEDPRRALREQADLDEAELAAAARAPGALRLGGPARAVDAADARADPATTRSCAPRTSPRSSAARSCPSSATCAS